MNVVVPNLFNGRMFFGRTKLENNNEGDSKLGTPVYSNKTPLF